jgi:hypothetical protein
MCSDTVGQRVMEWYQKDYNGPIFPTFKRQIITLETSLSSGEYPWADEDAIDILDEYFSLFHVDKRDFTFRKYWPNDETFVLFNFLRSKKNKRYWIEPEPLTLGMLVESAKAGYWLYG